MVNGRRKPGKMARRDAIVVLSDRDRFALGALRKAKVMRTSDFVPLVFPSLPITRRRLRKLMDAKFIACFVTSLSDDNRWVLDRRGWVALGLAEKAAPRSLADPGRHHFMMVRFWMLFVHATFKDPGVRLRKFSFEWELSGEHLNTLTPHRPDALVVVRVGDTELGFFVEIDVGSESPSYVASHKLAVFARLHAAGMNLAGVRADRLLVIAPTLRRLRSIARAAPNANASVLCGVMSEKTAALSLSDGWMTLASLVTEGPRMVQPFETLPGAMVPRSS